MLLTKFPLILLLAASAMGSGDDGDPAVEWYGAFDLPSDSTLLLQKVNGVYADAEMWMSYHNCSSLDAACISSKKADITALWETTPVDLVLDNTQGVGGPLKPNTLYNIIFAQSTFMSVLHLVPNTPGAHVLAMQHFPLEFEQFRHYLGDADGGDIEPAAEEGGGHAEEARPNHMLLAFAANVVITCATLVGLVMLLPCMSKLQAENFQVLAGSFATGTLLGASAFLILPEALLLVRTGYEEESMSNAVFGSVVCAGFFVGAFSHMAFSCVTARTENEGKEMSKMKDVEAVQVQVPQPKGGCCEYRLWNPVVWSVLLGDGLHNIADGVAVAVAFKLCDPAVGWVVTVGALAHEVSTELGDFLVLTGKGNMKNSAALGFNFLSGVAAIIGGLIASSVDMSDVTVGAILGLSAGMYLWICVEVFHSALTIKGCSGFLYVMSLLFLGILVVGLVLIGHEHCAVGHSH